jgi:hypothetical protein
VLHDARGQLTAVVDDDLGRGVRHREQVRVELVAGGAVPRVDLEPTGDERGADRVLRRPRVRARDDDLGARLGEEQREIRRLRLQVHDDGDAPSAERAVGEPLSGEPVQHRRVALHPADPLLARRRQRRVGDP